MELFQKYGGNLKYLHVYSYWGRQFDLRTPLRYCPTLEHLVLCPGLRFPLYHQVVKWVDIWSPRRFNERQNYIWLRRTFTRVAFPALQNVRRLDCGLLSTIDWPRLFPPEKNAYEGSGIEYLYPGIHIQVTAKQIIKQDLAYLGSDSMLDSHEDEGEGGSNQPGNDSNDDEDYVMSSRMDEDVTSDHSPWSSDDDMDDDMDGVDEVSEEGDWADRDMILSIFHQTLG